MSRHPYTTEPTLSTSTSSWASTLGVVALVLVLYVGSLPDIVRVVVPTIDHVVNIDPQREIIKAEILPLQKSTMKSGGQADARAEQNQTPETISVDVPPDPLAIRNVDVSMKGRFDDIPWTTEGKPKGDSRFTIRRPDGGGGNGSGNGGGGGNDTTQSSEPFEWAETNPEISLEALARAIRYPDAARRANVEGTVYVRVLIETDGSISETQIVESDNRMLNQAAINGIRDTHITPARQNGTAVRCWMVVPVSFKLRR